jgi:hypothetical protein
MIYQQWTTLKVCRFCGRASPNVGKMRALVNRLEAPHEAILMGPRTNFNDAKDLIPTTETDIARKTARFQRTQGAEAPSFGAEIAALPCSNRLWPAGSLPRIRAVSS